MHCTVDGKSFTGSRADIVPVPAVALGLVTDGYSRRVVTRRADGSASCWPVSGVDSDLWPDSDESFFFFPSGSLISTSSDAGGVHVIVSERDTVAGVCRGCRPEEDAVSDSEEMPSEL